MEASVQPKSKTREVMDSGLYMTIVETGCGTALASRFYELPGTSKIIYNSKQPYSKEYEKKIYGEFKRSISKEFIKAVLNVEIKEVEGTDVNCIYASSWQLGDEKAIMHGWVGVWHNNVKYYFHFTEKSNTPCYSRQDRIKSIGELGIEIMHGFVTNDLTLISKNSSFYMDEAYGGLNHFVSLKDILLQNQNNSDDDYPLMFLDRRAVRIAEQIRNFDNAVIYKGSFNPLHHQHKKIMDYSVAYSTPSTIGCFLISTNRFDKPSMSVTETLARINEINDHDYPVIICKSIYFYATFDLLKNTKGIEKMKFLFPMGVDTVDRIVGVDYRNYDIQHSSYAKWIDGTYSYRFKMLVFDRIGSVLNPLYARYGNLIEIVTEGYEDDGTSSSAIRAGKQENKIDDGSKII